MNQEFLDPRKNQIPLNEIQRLYPSLFPGMDSGLDAATQPAVDPYSWLNLPAGDEEQRRDAYLIEELRKLGAIVFFAIFRADHDPLEIFVKNQIEAAATASPPLNKLVLMRLVMSAVAKSFNHFPNASFFPRALFWKIPFLVERRYGDDAKKVQMDNMLKLLQQGERMSEPRGKAELAAHIGFFHDQSKAIRWRMLDHHGICELIGATSKIEGNKSRQLSVPTIYIMRSRRTHTEQNELINFAGSCGIPRELCDKEPQEV